MFLQEPLDYKALSQISFLPPKKTIPDSNYKTEVQPDIPDSRDFFYTPNLKQLPGEKDSTNLSLSSIGNSVFQGMIAHFSVTYVLGSYQQASRSENVAEFYQKMDTITG